MKNDWKPVLDLQLQSCPVNIYTIFSKNWHNYRIESTQGIKLQKWEFQKREKGRTTISAYKQIIETFKLLLKCNFLIVRSHQAIVSEIPPKSKSLSEYKNQSFFSLVFSIQLVLMWMITYSMQSLSSFMEQCHSFLNLLFLKNVLFFQVKDTKKYTVIVCTFRQENSMNWEIQLGSTSSQNSSKNKLPTFLNYCFEEQTVDITLKLSCSANIYWQSLPFS